MKPTPVVPAVIVELPMLRATLAHITVVDTTKQSGLGNWRPQTG